MKHQNLLVPLLTRSDERGRITVAQDGDHIPFAIERLFMLDNVPKGAQRGAHAHRRQHQFVIMAAGSCTIVVDDGRERSQITLDNSGVGLYAPPLHWLELSDFSEGAVCSVLASGHYDKNDYIADYQEFRRLTAEPKG